jgi:hypothetical protein
MNINRLFGKVKGFFFLFQLHVFTPVKPLEFWLYMGKLSKWIKVQQKRGFHDFYTFSFSYDRRFSLYKYILEKECLNNEIDYIEFGVSKGFSFKWWAENVSHTNARFYGFDTFNGLPEDWGPFKKGAMSSNNMLPEMNDKRCSFYQGLFQQTLPSFLSTYKPAVRRVIHMDADLYSSTLFSLTSISSFIKKDDIILFDEFNVPLHEFKAFIEWTSSFYIEYEVLASVNNFYQVALKIK